MMKKTALIFTILMSISLSFNYSLKSVDPVNDLNCEIINNSYYSCYSLAAGEITGFFNEDITCASSTSNFTCFNNCADYADACITSIELTRPSSLLLFNKKFYLENYSLIESITINKTLPKGTRVIVMISPYDVDFSKCVRENEENISFFECNYKREKATIIGLTQKGKLFLAQEIKQEGNNTLTYLISAIILIIVFYALIKLKARKEKKTKIRRRRVR